MTTHESYYHTTLVIFVTFTIITTTVQSFSSSPFITSFCPNKRYRHHIDDTLRLLLPQTEKNLPHYYYVKKGYKHTHTYTSSSSLYSSTSPIIPPSSATDNFTDTTPITTPLIPILFENSHLLAINKPPGIPYHSTNSTAGILTLLRIQQQQQQQQQRLYGVHRLDKITSGILLFAKSRHVAGLLSKMFRESSRVVKYYVAVSAKQKGKKKMGRIKGFMIKGRRGGYRLLSREESSNRRRGGGGGEEKKELGEWAESRFYTAGLGMLPVARAAAAAATTADDDSSSSSLMMSRRRPTTALLLRPLTGKTHQLRVAAKCAGMPILGDVTYGGGSSSERTYLHAMALHLNFEEGEMMDNVTIVSLPKFGGLWEDEGEGFVGVVKEMMNKYCDCEEILERL